MTTATVLRLVNAPGESNPYNGGLTGFLLSKAAPVALEDVVIALEARRRVAGK